jgi:hypothetical protein
VVGEWWRIEEHREHEKKREKERREVLVSEANSLVIFLGSYQEPGRGASER